MEKEKLGIRDIYRLIKNTLWLAHDSGVVYAFTEVKFTNEIIWGALYIGEKLIEFEIDRYNTNDSRTFSIDKYLFEIINENQISVTVGNDKDQNILIRRITE